MSVPSGTQHFVFALVEGYTHLALSCAVDPLRIANLVSEKPLYSWSFASLDGKTATASNEAVTLVHHAYSDIPPCDRLFVLSGIHMQKREHGPLIAALRHSLRKRKSILGALDSGAYILAKGGFLNGIRTAIHWEYHDGFVESFPEVPLVRNVFVADEKIITASGGTATADLMLHLIEKDHGYDLMVAVADQMLYTAARDAGVAQKVSLQSKLGTRNQHLTRAIDIMRRNIDEPVTPSVIAADLGISVRQLERLFGRHLNTSPKKYYTEMRLERARNLLMQTEMSIIEVAFASGFESAGHFSRVYRLAYGVTPRDQRARYTGQGELPVRRLP
ncbi:GlxA family transcriptional regulator [Cereibacter sphaeroides]|nr:GlxA family transcriptional regulator [Cereibacter sphaeroides]